MVRDVEEDERFRGVPSLQLSETRAAICCPLISRDDVVGAIVYPDRRGAGYGISRYEDDPRLDFSQVEGEPDVHFAHKSGFMCKTSATAPERLRELMGFLVAFPEEELAQIIPARVIGMPGGRVVEGMKIDKGLTDSLAVDMPIVVPGGLVGKISSASPSP